MACAACRAASPVSVVSVAGGFCGGGFCGGFCGALGDLEVSLVSVASISGGFCGGPWCSRDVASVGASVAMGA